MIRVSLFTFALLVVGACAPQREAERDSTAVASPAAAVTFTPPDSTALLAATPVLGEFLDASREGSATASPLPTA